MRKLLRKYTTRDSISISRMNKNINISNLLSISVMKLISKDMNILEICDSLKNLDFIEYAEPNFIRTFNSSIPNDSYYAFQEGLEQTNDIDIDAERAWNFTTGNSGIRVGVIDNGIDYDHEDLGNGVFGVSGAKVRGGWDYFDNDSDPDYIQEMRCSHGTEVAGIIGAYRNNNKGIAGLAGGDGVSNTGCQLFALKVGNTTCTSKGLGLLSVSAIIEAIIDGSNSSPGYGCHILNNSYGSLNSYSEAEREAVANAVQNNVVFVASKGNDSSSLPNYPSDYDPNWIVSVGATDIYDYKAWFSNTGHKIDVAAPGDGSLIYTTTPIENGDYTTFGGTSASAPVVSGQAALILSEALEQSVSLHHNDVEGIIKFSAEDVNFSSKPGYDDDLGYGRVNAGKSLEMMNKPWKLQYHTANGGTVVNTSGWFNMFLYNPGGGLASGTYSVKKYEVQKTITMPDYLNDGFIWCRTTNETVGWSAANPNYQLGYCDIISRVGNSVTLRTFVYDIYSGGGSHIGFLPSTTSNVVFAYTTLGIPCYEDLHLFEPIYEATVNDPVVYSASDEITASNKINSGADVKYKAGNSITLWAGFEAREGSEFHAKIESCTETQFKRASGNSNLEPNHVQINENSLSISPNPVTSISDIKLTVGAADNVSLVLYDNLGNQRFTYLDNISLKSGTYNYKLDGNVLNSGMFVLVLKIDDITITEKVINLK